MPDDDEPDEDDDEDCEDELFTSAQALAANTLVFGNGGAHSGNK